MVDPLVPSDGAIAKANAPRVVASSGFGFFLVAFAVGLVAFLGLGFVGRTVIHTFAAPVSVTNKYLNAAFNNDIDGTTKYSCSDGISPLVDIEVILGAPIISIKSFNVKGVILKAKQRPNESYVDVELFGFQNQHAHIVSALEKRNGHWLVCGFVSKA